jgi:hemolysin activation/secretion protein
VRIEVTAIDINGASVFSDAELQPLYADMLGKRVLLQDIYRLAASIAAKYRRAGYFLAQAIVPPQEIAGGVVQIRVIEGYVAKAVIEGDIQGPRALLQGYADKIVADRPARLQTFERYLLLMNDLPGVTARGTLEPDPAEVGAADLIIHVSHKSIDATAAIDDRGTRFLGPYQAELGADLNSLAHLYDQLSLQAVGTTSIRELRYGEARYVQPIGTEGFRTELAASISESHPGFTLSNDNVHSDYRTLSLSGFYPVLRSRTENLTLGAGFNLQDSITDELALRAFDDRLRYLSASAQYDLTDLLKGVDLVYLDGRHGFDGLGSSRPDDPGVSNPGAAPDFTLVHATLQRQQDLGFLMPRLGLLASADGQYTGQKLFIAQQYAFGGDQYGRAYDPAEIIGDRGVAVKLEPQYSLAGIPGVIDYFQLYTYYDFGYIDKIAPPAGTPLTETGAAAGIGLRYFASRFSGYFEAAKPLTREVAALGNDGKDVRFFFRLSARY